MPQIRKKNGELRDVNGQLAHPDESPARAQNPVKPAKADIPTILEDYTLVVAAAVAEFKAKTSFKTADINAVAALGRAMAQLQAVEEARLARIGEKRVQDLSTAELRSLMAPKEPPTDAVYEDIDPETGLSLNHESQSGKKEDPEW